MKRGCLMKRFFFTCILLLFPLITFGDTSPFTLRVNPLKERIPAGDLLPVTVSITIAPNHRLYKDQIKVDSVDPSRFVVTSTELPVGKIKYDPFLEKEVENYEGQVEVKSFVQVSKDIPAGPHSIKLKVHYQGCSEKICFIPKMEEFLIPVQVESADWSRPVSQLEEKPLQLVSKPEKKSRGWWFPEDYRK